MELIDTMRVPEGFFQLHSYDAESGQLLDVVEGHNIVVNHGREALARLLGNHDPGSDPPTGDYSGVASWHVDTMRFGDGGHDPGDQTVMVTVSVTDEDLYGTEHIAKTAAATWPAERKVTFTSTVEAAEGNGSGFLEYSEAGLYYGVGAGTSTWMFAHKAFGYIVKNNTIKLVATWTFTF
jgi:hypothetical protein